MTDPTRRRPLGPERKAQLASASYEQGFGKPPKTAQFAKGRSGNPNGKPKGARSLRSDLLEVLDIKVTVSTPGGPMEMPAQRAMLYSAAAKAMRGDVRAFQALVQMISAVAPDRLGPPPEEAPLEPHEQAQLAKLLEGLGLPAQSAKAGASDEPEKDNG